MTDAAQTPERRTELAAEYAIGLLSGDELAEAERLYAIDPAFRAGVADWAARLAPLLDEVEPVAPPSTLLPSVEKAIGFLDAATTGQALRRSRNRWRAFSIAASSIAATLALALFVAPGQDRAPLAPPGQQASVMVAALGPPDGPAKMLASWNSGSRRLTIAATAGSATGADRSHELWVIPADGTPRSLGVMPESAEMRMDVETEMAPLLSAGAVLAVSEEPLGGSPTGKPTGPVIASGKLENA